MKTSVRKIMIRTFVLAAIIWGIAYLLAAAATRLNLPPGLLRDGWDSLEAGVVAPLRSNWLAAAAAAVTFGFTIDQTGFPETVQDRLFPPRPDFLSWREEAGVGALLRRRIPIAGRDAELRRLRSWLRGRRTEHRVQAFGVYGARGIGKTRLILEAFRRLNPWWRLWRRWHVGVLTGPVPIGTRFRRPTAILVDYAVDAELFWRSAESLVRQHHEHPVRIVFESPVDFDKMVEGRAEHRTAPLRAILPRVTDAVDAPEGAAEPLRPGAQVSINPTTARRFLQLAPLDAASAKDLLTSAYGAFAPQRRRNRSWRAARARRTNAPAIIAAARGRPSYLLEFAVRAEEARPDLIATQPDLMRRTIDAWAVPREDAELLVEEAVSIFPEEGLELVLLAALGQGRKIPAEDRYEIAPGSGDRLRLSRLFRNYGEDEGVDADLLNEAPTIANAHVAHFAMMAILRRLQRADLQGFVKRVTRSESVALQAVQARLAEMLMAAWPPSDDSADPGLEDFVPAQMYGGLVAALLLLPEAAPLDVRRTVVERLQRPPFAPRSMLPKAGGRPTSSTKHCMHSPTCSISRWRARATSKAKRRGNCRKRSPATRS
ncbi:MAG: ATP-binding protein [Sphingomonas sp.]